MEKFIKFVGGTVLVATSAIFRGFVLSALWGWFVVPLGAPAIGIALAIGLSLMLGMFTVNLVRKEKEGKSFGEAQGESLVLSATFLLFGWLVHLAV